MLNYLTKLLFKPKIPVICLRQNITAGVYHSISRQLNLTCNVQALAIVIDSEKGQPVQTELLANRIKAFSKKHQIPVYSFVETRCTGEPYLLVATSDKSYCLESSIVGVYRNYNWFGVSGLLKDYKIQQRSWVSNVNSVLRVILPFSNTDKSQLITRVGQIQVQIADKSIKNMKHQHQNVLSLEQNLKFEQYYIGKEAINKKIIGQIGNVYSVLAREFPDSQLKFIEHSTVLKEYLGIALALPFVGILLLLGFKSFLKYFTLFIIYLFYKSKANKKEKSKQIKE